jgi:hypothetical protein
MHRLAFELAAACSKRQLSLDDQRIERGKPLMLYECIVDGQRPLNASEYGLKIAAHTLFLLISLYPISSGLFNHSCFQIKAA